MHKYLEENNEKEVELKTGGTHKLYISPKAGRDFRLYITDFDNKSEDLIEIINQLRDATPNDELHIYIDSHGGYVDELLRFRIFLKNTFSGRVTTYLEPKGYSCGAFIFCMGDKRVCYADSVSMFHTWSQFLVGKSHEIEAQQKFDQEHLKRIIIELMSDYFSDEEIARMNRGEDFWLTCKEMCKRGLCTHVIEHGIEVPADVYLNALKNLENKDNKKSKKPSKKSK